MADKLTTEEIIKLIREQDGGGAAPAAAESEEPAAEAVEQPDAVEEKPKAAPAASKKPAAAPKGTAGILAAIRAQDSGGGAAAEAADEPAADEPASSPAPAAKKPAGGAAPKGTADILAAIRGGGGGGAKADAPAAKASPKKKAATTAPAGDLPPVKEMLEQLRAGKKPATAAAGDAPSAKPVRPQKPELKIPTRPAKPAAKSSSVPRRAVILALVATPFALAWTLLSGMAGAWLLLLARFMFPNMIVEPPTTFKIGPPSDYPFGTVSTKWTAARGIWVVHTDQYKGRNLITVMASVCTHLGCTPSWLEGEQKFKCPCHGSGFYISGMNFEGPAPRPLERVGVRIAPDGMLEVDKAVKFQEEKGQWEDDKSFVEIA